MGVVPPAEDCLPGSATWVTPRRRAPYLDEGHLGFRAPRPAARRRAWRVRPDLTCLGKIIGGGLPVARLRWRSISWRSSHRPGPSTRLEHCLAIRWPMTAGLWSLASFRRASIRSSNVWYAARGGPGRFGPADASCVTAGQCLRLRATPFFTSQPVRDYQSASHPPANTQRSAGRYRARHLSAAVTVRRVLVGVATGRFDFQSALRKSMKRLKASLS